MIASASARAEADALMGALIDPVTGLFNYSFLSYKLDEEFKRARRFHAPLACAMLGFESQASDDTLRELSSIFLAASRDTDVLGRFDENSFLFLLPNTGPDGAEIMAQRVANTADESRLLDLVGDRIELSIGTSLPAPPRSSRVPPNAATSTSPTSSIEQRVARNEPGRRQRAETTTPPPA